MAKKQVTIPSYTFEDTTDPNLKRFVDRKGDWTHYHDEVKGQFIPAVNHILGLGYNKGPGFYQYLLSVTAVEAKQRLESAGEEGTRTHQAIRNIIDGLAVRMTTKFYDERTGRQEVLNDDEWTNLEGFLAWYNDFKPETIAQEMSVFAYHRSRGFAGTADYICTVLVPDGAETASGVKNPFPKKLWGQRVLMLPLDWKTSGAVWKEYKAQVASYNYALAKNYKDLAKFIDAYPVFTGVVRIGTQHKNGYEFKVWDDKGTKENFKRFDAAYEIYLEEESEFKPKVREIPTEFFVKVPKAKVVKSGKAKKQSPRKATKKKSPARKAVKRTAKKKRT